jgi:monofunctional biosynthetic peptidoglycan transglycosylase
MRIRLLGKSRAVKAARLQKAGRAAKPKAMAKAKQQPRERMAPPAAERGKRGILSRLLRLALIIVCIPLVLTVVYIVVPPVSTLMIYERIVRGPIERDWVPLDRMAPSLPAAAVMSEDGQFCRHRGVDWVQLNKVIDDEDGPQRGASTIAMQTVKNLFLWNSRSYVRKAFEIPLALYADAVLGKRRVMEIYLNIAEFGPGIFGAEAAARHYFGRPAAELGDLQSALLIAALPNPSARNPGKPGPGMTALATRILGRARMAGGYIDCLSR